MTEERYSDIRFKKVKNLQGRAREIATEKNLQDDDLVILRTSINSPPEYTIEKVEGDPLKTLFSLGKKKVLIG